MDVVGGGSSTEALVGIAIGLIEAGCCKTVAIFRSMNGFLAGAHRRHRSALGGAGWRRHAAQPRLWLAERRAELRADLYAPYVRLRDDPRTGRTCKDVPQQPRLEQPEGLLQEALHGRGRHQQPLHLQAAAPAGLLRRDRQRDLHHRDQRRAGEGLQAPAGPDPRRRRALQQAAARHALSARADFDRRRLLREEYPVAEFRGRSRGYRRDRLLRRLHLHDDAAARGLRVLQEGRRRPATSATARSASAASGRTTPRAAICAKAIRTG